jgi:CheY-like chemotaxis protein
VPAILIVDDEEDMREFLRDVIEEDGYVVFEASCGREAIDLTLSVGPDMILLDIIMPDIDGWEVMRIIREHEGLGDIPILMCSGSNDAKKRHAKESPENCAFMAKPFEMEALRKKISDCLKSSGNTSQEARRTAAAG